MFIFPPSENFLENTDRHTDRETDREKDRESKNGAEVVERAFVLPKRSGSTLS